MQLFGLHAEDDAFQLDDTHHMQRHFRVFTNLIDLMVRNIAELDMQMAPVLITYGRRHFYKHHVGFTPAYIAVFATGFLRAVVEVAGDVCDDVTLAGWNELIQYLVIKMKHGYDMESMHRGAGYKSLL